MTEGMIRGNAAIEDLARRTHAEDPGESSHWRAYHAAFEFAGDRFRGLQGFGGSEKPPRGWRAIAHPILQRRYRALAAGYRAFPDIDRLGAEITRRQDRAYDMDVVRQSITLAFLTHHVPGRLTRTSTVAVIGDGFASMTSLLLARDAARHIVVVNLTKTLLVDLWYLKAWLGADRFDSLVVLATDAEGAAAARASCDARIIAIEAANHELLRQMPLDLAINIASMQEMNPPVTSQYFADLRTSRTPHDEGVAFYCCNREEKRLPDGTITRFAAYPWLAEDRILVDELCPWHQQHYRFRPPFYRPYDGPTRHRLAYLAAIASP